MFQTTNQQLNQGGTYQQGCHFSIKMGVISHGVKHRKLLISMMVLSRKPLTGYGWQSPN